MKVIWLSNNKRPIVWGSIPRLLFVKTLVLEKHFIQNGQLIAERISNASWDVVCRRRRYALLHFKRWRPPKRVVEKERIESKVETFAKSRSWP